MRIAIVSDIHANLPAFDAVVADWGQIDALWCLGDVVGYGPDPVACVDRLRDLEAVCIAGNHDWAAIGRLDLAEFSGAAAEAVRWTARQLTPSARAYLEGLPDRHLEGQFTLAHGSPRAPIWEYVLDRRSAEENFAAFSTATCFIGHTHRPIAYAMRSDPATGRPTVTVEPPVYREVAIDQGRHLINVGSVGQPRDGDPTARYVILDTERQTYLRRRVVYDITDTQQRMRQSGLPDVLQYRLAVGR
ncbi:MAG TPA: metallophosphoesterase family protein [Chloroflexota bacterium]|nr:metallophosphoesterase family protein [Chloroflexota bacterium]